MVVFTRAGCRAALFLWIFISISCRARTALPASRTFNAGDYFSCFNCDRK